MEGEVPEESCFHIRTANFPGASGPNWLHSRCSDISQELFILADPPPTWCVFKTNWNLTHPLFTNLPLIARTRAHACTHTHTHTHTLRIIPCWQQQWPGPLPARLWWIGQDYRPCQVIIASMTLVTCPASSNTAIQSQVQPPGNGGAPSGQLKSPGKIMTVYFLDGTEAGS